MEHLPLQITVNRTRNKKRNAKDHCTFWYLSFIYWPCTVNVMKHSVQCPYLYYIKMILLKIIDHGRKKGEGVTVTERSRRIDSVWAKFNTLFFLNSEFLLYIKNSSVLQNLFNKKYKNANYWNEQVNSIFHSFEGPYANSREKITKITSRAQLFYFKTHLTFFFFKCHWKSLHAKFMQNMMCTWNISKVHARHNCVWNYYTLHENPIQLFMHSIATMYLEFFSCCVMNWGFNDQVFQ